MALNLDDVTLWVTHIGEDQYTDPFYLDTGQFSDPATVHLEYLLCCLLDSWDAEG